MNYRFQIKFEYEELSFQASVKEENFIDYQVYKVYYFLSNYHFPVEIVQIYRGGAPKNQIFWRQRANEENPFFIDTSLISIIGAAIESQHIPKNRDK